MCVRAYVGVWVRACLFVSMCWRGLERVVTPEKPSVCVTIMSHLPADHQSDHPPGHSRLSHPSKSHELTGYLLLRQSVGLQRDI